MCGTLTNLARRVGELRSSNLFYSSICIPSSALPAGPLPVVSGKPHGAITYNVIVASKNWDPVHDPEKHNPEWTQSRMDTIPNGHNPEWTPSRMDTIPNGHNPEWTQSRMDTIPNGHNPEWTPSRMDTIPNGHNPEWTQSRKDTIPNGHNPEWTQSRMSNYNYIVTLVFNSYCLVRSLLRRRGFKQKLILCMNLSDL